MLIMIRFEINKTGENVIVQRYYLYLNTQDLHIHKIDILKQLVSIEGYTEI